MHVDLASHMSLGTPCLQPKGIETSSPYLSLGNGDNNTNIPFLLDVFFIMEFGQNFENESHSNFPEAMFHKTHISRFLLFSLGNQNLYDPIQRII
jgi:hypothetical protein